MRDYFNFIVFLVTSPFWGAYRAGRAIARAVKPAAKRKSTPAAPSYAVSKARTPAATPGAAEVPLPYVARAVQNIDFQAADRIISIGLMPAVGVINLRVYKASKTIKRDLIINEPRLRAIMKGRRFTFADTAFDPKSDLEEVKDETVQLAEDLINRLGNARVKGKKPTKDEQRAEIAKPAPVAKAKDPEQQKTQAQPVAKQQAKPAAPSKSTSVEKPKGMESKVFAPTPTVGITYVGVLKQSGSHRMTPRDREPYEVFQATILLDNGAELPLRGAELERELDAAGCQVGERVSITPMGKVPVTLAGGREGSKNLYKVENLMVSA